MIPDDFVLNCGFHKGKKLRDVALADLDKFLGWLEEHDARPDLQKVLKEYLEQNHYNLEG